MAVRLPRPMALLLLTAVVTLVHLWLADGTLQTQLGEGDAARLPARIDVSFVRELLPSKPPLVAPAPAPARPSTPPHARPVAAAASAVAPAEAAAAREPAPPPPAEPVAQAEPEPVLDPIPALAPTPELVASAPAAPPAPQAQPFEWPPSTRLTYALTGNWNGPVEGQAQIEWLRSGERYQVRVEVSVGPSFAPLARRTMVSDGRLGPAGLEPQRYDQDTKMLFREPRRQGIAFEDSNLVLADGQRVPRPPGVQDSVSQFVQMTWLFTTRPELLVTGRSVDIPLALPRRVEVWAYDVLETETLYGPAGPVEAVHVKPRRESRPGGDIVAETWVAPTLQYLPVRVVMRQGPDIWLDLLIKRLPQQAAAPATAR